MGHDLDSELVTKPQEKLKIKFTPLQGIGLLVAVVENRDVQQRLQRELQSASLAPAAVKTEDGKYVVAVRQGRETALGEAGFYVKKQESGAKKFATAVRALEQLGVIAGPKHEGSTRW